MAKRSHHTPGPSTGGDAKVSAKKEGFTILYNGEGDVVADVVFVHGLQGHAKDSWTKRLPSQPKKVRKISFLQRQEVVERDDIDDGDDRNMFWPQDLLPQKIENIRILTYGYDSKAEFIQSANQNGIYQYAENLLAALERVRQDCSKDVKIVFIAHSLGGIIVKEALRQSSKHTHQPHLLSIFNATYGIVFFGCPHQGSGATEWGLVVANLAKLAGISSNIDLIRSLGMDSQTLKMISSDFSVFMGDKAFKVHSFREEKGMTGIAGISDKVVEDISSIIGDAAEGKEGINANHRDMCKFESLEDEGFLKAAGVISRYVKELEVLRNSRKDTIQKAQKNDRKQDVAKLSEKEEKCLQSLYHADYSTHRHRIPKRHPGTLEWVLKHEAYQEWVSENTKSMFLWVSGNPGCGKTVASAFFLDCLDKRANATDTNVAYFFCDDKEERQKSAQSLLRGLIHQLITATPSLIKHAMVHYSTQGTKMLESLDTLWRIFLSVATDPDSNGTYIILDALDECERTSRDDLLRRLSDYFRLEGDKTANTYLKVLITSRPYQEIQRLLQEQPTIRLRTEDEAGNINEDISSFILHKVDVLAESCHYDPELKEEVRETLQTGADGMFLWVALIFEELLDTPISLVSEILASIPGSLDGVYTHLLKRLDGRKAQAARKILMWVVTAPRAMTVTELATACSVKSSHKSLSSIGNALIAGFKHDIDLCGPILKIQDGVVHLVHQSAKEFLLNLDLRGSLPDFSIHPKQANSELAISCLTYLSFDNFDHELPKPHYLERSILPLPEYQFFAFAAKFWPQFVQHADEQPIWQSFCRFAQPGKRLNLAFYHFCSAGEYHDLWEPTNMLFIAAYFGLSSFVGHILDQGNDVNAWSRSLSSLYVASKGGHETVVQILLGKGADVNARGGKYGNALQAASEGGHETVVQILLGKGADVNAQGGRYGNALLAASEGGHETVVQILLGKGADVNAQGGFYGNALLAASEGGHETVVQILLGKGADVNARGGRYGNALQAASKGGHETVVQILLGKGADVNARGGKYGNALLAASEGGHETVVRLLLGKGADVNAQGGFYGNALQAASKGGHETVVRLLLAKGADVNAQGGFYGNALQAASKGGHETVVQLLLAKGADVNAQGGEYGNALQAASEGGHETVVQILLAEGADVNAQGGEYGNALQAASKGGHETVVQLLLGKGADVNAQGGFYGNALQAASEGGHETVVQLPLGKGADVNTRGGLSDDTLQGASEGGHETVVQLPLGKGADVNAQGGFYGNALQAASEGGHETVVQILLGKGADVNAQGGEYGNALQAASEGGHETVVQLLLGKGADVNAQGGKYGNALQAASEGGHETVVQILLGKGADVNAQGGFYGTALQAASAGGHKTIVQLLLGKGADVNARGGRYGNALQAASERGHGAIVQLLLGKGARGGQPLQAAAEKGHEAAIS